MNKQSIVKLNVHRKAPHEKNNQDIKCSSFLYVLMCFASNNSVSEKIVHTNICSVFAIAKKKFSSNFLADTNDKNCGALKYILKKGP